MAQEIFIVLQLIIHREIEILCSTQIKHLDSGLHYRVSYLYIQMHLIENMGPLLEVVRPTY